MRRRWTAKGRATPRGLGPRRLYCSDLGARSAVLPTRPFVMHVAERLLHPGGGLLFIADNRHCRARPTQTVHLEVAVYPVSCISLQESHTSLTSLPFDKRLSCYDLYSISPAGGVIPASKPRASARGYVSAMSQLVWTAPRKVWQSTFLVLLCLAAGPASGTVSQCDQQCQASQESALNTLYATLGVPGWSPAGPGSDAAPAAATVPAHCLWPGTACPK